MLLFLCLYKQYLYFCIKSLFPFMIPSPIPQIVLLALIDSTDFNLCYVQTFIFLPASPRQGLSSQDFF